MPPAPPPPPPAPVAVGLVTDPSGGHVIGMGLSATLQLDPKVVLSNGSKVPPSGTVAYSSNAPAIISVTPTGFLTALALGSTKILATTTYDGKEVADTLSVSVTCTAELRADVTPLNPVLAVGGKFTPTLALSTCGGLVSIQTVVTWTAADPSVLSIDPGTSETTALKAGTTLLIARGASPYNFPLTNIQVTVQ